MFNVSFTATTKQNPVIHEREREKKLSTPLQKTMKSQKKIQRIEEK